MLGYESLLWYGLQKSPQDTSISFILAAYYNREEVIDKMLSDPNFRGKIPHVEALLHISCSNHTRTIWVVLDSFEDSAGPNHAYTGLRVVLSDSFVSGNVNIAEEAISSPNENHESIVRLLLDLLDPVSPLFTSVGGNYYPLGLAAEIGHLPSVQNLLERGAPVGFRDGSGKTALDYAVECGHVDIMRELRTQITTKEV